jgi:hypothetical protein
VSEFIDQLEHELREATKRRVRVEAARVPHPAGTGLSVALSVGLCAAILLVAIQLHARPAAVHRSPVSGRAPAAPAVAPAARAVDPRIVASFAAFRRPRTASDGLPAGLEFGSCGGEGPGNYSWCSNSPPTLRSALFQPASAANRWRLMIYGHPHYLQTGQSRRIPLPHGLGSIWLIPSGRWLCAFFHLPTWRNYQVTMTCGTIGLILRRPPIHIAGYFFGPAAHGILITAEPDKITRAAIAYPGGTEPALLHDGALEACVGQGAYKLEQTTAAGTRLKPVLVGAYGSFKPTSCPALGVAIK